MGPKVLIHGDKLQHTFVPLRKCGCGCTKMHHRCICAYLLTLCMMGTPSQMCIEGLIEAEWVISLYESDRVPLQSAIQCIRTARRDLLTTLLHLAFAMPVDCPVYSFIIPVRMCFCLELHRQLLCVTCCRVTVAAAALYLWQVQECILMRRCNCSSELLLMLEPESKANE